MGFGLKDKASLAYQKDKSKSFRYKENALVLGLVGTTVLSGILLTLPRVLADDSTVTDVAITVPVACSITSTLDSAHTASVDSGTYKDNIGKTTIKATCNDSQGFSIYAIGYTNEEYGNTVLKPSTLDSPQNDIATGIATNGDTSNWAMKLTASTGMTSANILSDTDGAYSNYHKVPTAYTKVATMASVTDATVGASLETTYSAYIAGDQPADIYTGKVKYTMVHPASAPEPFLPHEETTASGRICYYPNTDEHEGTMGCQNVSSSVTLLASNFSRTGYGFAGWSNKFDYATNKESDLKFYGPQETITIPDTSIYTGEGKGLSLYAVWVKSQGNLQDANKVASVCSGLTAGATNLTSVSALTDQRDNQTYAIAKLADGKCWMIENLRLESTASHNTDGTLAQGYGTSTTYGNFSGLTDAESTDFSSTYTANSLYYSGTQEGTASIDIGTSSSSYPAYRMPRYNNLNTQSRAQNSPSSNTLSNNNTDGGMYSYGNYYTWHAAIADLTHNYTTNQSTTNTSLCPNGWRLPQGGDKTRIESDDDNDFWNLTVDGLNGGTNPANYDSQTRPYYIGTDEAGPVADKLRSYPNNFLYSGYFYSSSAYYRGSYGYYWSSTAFSNGSSYTLYLYSSFVYPGTSYNYKYYGFSIRCVSDS